MLTMRGPQFLLLFATMVVIAYIAVGSVIAARERERWPVRRPIRDPYAIAFLRGGYIELMKVVALALTLRGLLKVGAAKVESTDPQAMERVEVPIEKAVLKACATPVTPESILLSPAVKVSADTYKRELQDLKLLADDEVREVRLRPVLVTLMLLGGLALAKIAVALATGHRNIAFLIILLLIA